MTILIATKVTGIMDAEDKRAMVARITLANVGRVTKLPLGTAAEIKDSYATILTEGDNSEHLTNIASAQDASLLDAYGFGEDNRKLVRAKVLDLIQAGQDAATVLAKIAALS